MAEPAQTRTRRMAWHGMALMLLAGCAPAASSSDADVEILLRALSSDAAAAAPDTSDYSHDFGPVLARGQTLRHEFTLRNLNGKPLRILDAEALTPCCSEIERKTLPQAVPPGGEAKIAALFRTGNRTGAQRLIFVVTTDDPRRSTVEFELIATLVPEIEIGALDGSNTEILTGRGGTQTLEIVCRRMGEDGMTGPEHLDASPPLSAEWLGPVEEAERADGMRESTRRLQVNLPASHEIGDHLGSLILRWADGTTRDVPVGWRVNPIIRAVPSGLFLGGDGAGERVSRTIQLRSEERPFRVLGVTGPSFARCGVIFPSEPDTVHSFSFDFDLSSASAERAFDLTFRTDHPDQPTVVVSVLIRSNEEKTP